MLGLSFPHTGGKNDKNFVCYFAPSSPFPDFHKYSTFKTLNRLPHTYTNHVKVEMGTIYWLGCVCLFLKWILRKFTLLPDLRGALPVFSFTRLLHDILWHRVRFYISWINGLVVLNFIGPASWSALNGKMFNEIKCSPQICNHWLLMRKGYILLHWWR